MPTPQELAPDHRGLISILTVLGLGLALVTAPGPDLNVGTDLPTPSISPMTATADPVTNLLGS